ncbi:MAG: glycosyltransferase family 1 protein, partial [Mesorhizobium sp.]
MIKSAHEARDLYRFEPAAPLRSRRAWKGALERSASCRLVAVPPPRR